MKAWEVIDGKLAYCDVPMPRAAPGEVVIQVTHVGICGSDVAKLRRPEAFALPEPWRPGHEIVGLDEVGQAVIVDALVPCGRCGSCAVGDIHCCPDLRRIGWDLPGGFAEYVAVPRANLRPVPAGLDPDLAVLADPAAVAVHGVRCSGPTPPGRLAVLGAGTIGLLTAAYASEIGWDVTVLIRSHSRLACLTRGSPFRFVHVADAASERPFDVVVDAATGHNSQPLELALQLIRDGGTVVVQNAYEPGVLLQTPLRSVFRRSIRLVGSFSYCRRKDPDDLAEALDLVRRLPDISDCLTSERWPAVNLPEALDALRVKDATKAVLRT